MWASADLVLVATLEELDLPPLPADAAVSLSYTGPVLPEDLGQPDRAGSEPTVLVSLSTTFIPGQTRILQAVLDGLAQLPVRGLVTTGPAIDGDGLRVPANTQTHRYLPHRTVMPASSVLVGHGGHATTMLALAHDLPLVIIPANSQFDQPTIGRVIEEAGAGILLPASASPERIRGAIEKVLADDRYRVEAARLGAAIRASNGTTVAADHPCTGRPKRTWLAPLFSTLPPSTTITWPVMYEAPGEANQAMADATSAAVPLRRIGTRRPLPLRSAANPWRSTRGDSVGRDAGCCLVDGEVSPAMPAFAAA